MENNKPKVGIGILIIKNKQILLGKRKSSHGEGQYSFPGGHLEYMESFIDCAQRELAEECGVKIKNIRFQFLSNVDTYTPKHYVHIGLVADWDSGDPQVLEPDKCEHWNWYDLDNVPSPIFTMAQQAIDSYKSGQNFYDIPEKN